MLDRSASRVEARDSVTANYYPADVRFLNKFNKFNKFDKFLQIFSVSKTDVKEERYILTLAPTRGGCS